MSRQQRATRDALTRLRAASLDLIAAKRFTESNDVLAIIERIDPPAATAGEAGSVGSPGSRPGSSEAVAVVPSAAAPPSTTWVPPESRFGLLCASCGHTLPQHCTTHIIPCCPGSLMHGMDEGSWTPTDLGPR